MMTRRKFMKALTAIGAAVGIVRPDIPQRMPRPITSHDSHRRYVRAREDLSRGTLVTWVDENVVASASFGGAPIAGVTMTDIQQHEYGWIGDQWLGGYIKVTA